MKLSRLYGTVIESEDEKKRGTVLGACCANGKISGYICFDERENEFFVQSQSVKVKRGRTTFLKTVDGPAGKVIKLGVAVFSDCGEYLGALADVTVRGAKPVCADVGKNTYPFERLIFGDVIILKSENHIKTCAEVAAKDMFIEAMCGRS